MSTTNVPVHDYEPSPTDIIRLNEADVFLYHGLGLEPWVDGALADMENDNLVVAETHAVADGSQTLLFNEIMINTLCSDLSSLGTQDIHILHETMYFMDELNSDDAAYNMGMPDDHDDHDHDDHGDDDHDDHDHDDHGDDDHDDHDHDDHGMTMMMIMMTTVTTIMMAMTMMTTMIMMTMTAMTTATTTVTITAI